jgi:hypothetical protein
LYISIQYSTLLVIIIIRVTYRSRILLHIFCSKSKKGKVGQGGFRITTSIRYCIYSGHKTRYPYTQGFQPRKIRSHRMGQIVFVRKMTPRCDSITRRGKGARVRGGGGDQGREHWTYTSRILSGYPGGAVDGDPTNYLPMYLPYPTLVPAFRPATVRRFPPAPSTSDHGRPPLLTVLGHIFGTAASEGLDRCLRGSPSSDWPNCHDGCT